MEYISYGKEEGKEMISAAQCVSFVGKNIGKDGEKILR